MGLNDKGIERLEPESVKAGGDAAVKSERIERDVWSILLDWALFVSVVVCSALAVIAVALAAPIALAAAALTGGGRRNLSQKNGINRSGWRAARAS